MSSRAKCTRQVCLSGLVFLIGTAGPVAAQGLAPAQTLMHQMAGTWDVQEWTWAGPGAGPTPLPAAVAERRPVGDAFVQESMSTPLGAAGAFSRHAIFGFNPINRQFEYASIDSRAPQLMSEHSAEASPEKDGSLNLLGGMFFTPQWGAMSNVTFRYRLVVGPIENDRQEVDLYLTPVSGREEPEFIAFRYLYTRRP
jgi:hypothetical protein